MPLIAQAASDAGARVFYEASRFYTMEPWQWVVTVVVMFIALALMLFMYLKDSVELPTGVTATLLVLRLLAFIGLLVFFLDIEKRSETKIIKNSRVAMLIDTSQSMGIRDTEFPSEGSDGTAADTSRIERVVNYLGKGELLNKLREKHDVIVYGFSEETQPVEMAVFQKIAPPKTKAGLLTEQRRNQALSLGRQCVMIAGGLLAGSLLTALVYMLFTGPEPRGWLLFFSLMLLFASATTTAVGALGSSELPFLAVLNVVPIPEEVVLEDDAPDAADADEDEGNNKTDATEEATDKPLEPEDVLWAAKLLPDGGESRIGEAIRWLTNRERGGSLAGVVLISDGGNNAGIAPSDAARLASDAGISIYPVGLGSIERPKLLRAADLYAPKRVYPGDKFTATGSLQGFGFEGATVRVSLTVAPFVDGKAGTESPVGEPAVIKISEDGQILAHRFELEPEAAGEWQYKFRVEPPAGAELADKQKLIKTTNVVVVEKKNQVLLIAGGPTREFRFLRNQMYRDKSITVHVWLQSGQKGISQEADELLTEFPTDAEKFFKYDTIIAIDPDWLDLTEADARLLEKWVGDKAGGLVCIAGPVNTPEWSNLGRGNTVIDIIKGLYPVVFFSRGSATLRLGRFGAEEAWPLEFTREGKEAEFLWVEDDAVANDAAWADFEGVYGYYSVRDPKPAAKVFARFSDPSTEIDGTLPIYLAGHFYGAGRVFFQASGEMWRVRAVDDAYFERYYTKLVRWAGERRLLRDSSRGVLLVDPERCNRGQQVTVQAKLTDAQFEPLNRDQVSAALILPDGKTPKELVLRRFQGSSEGMFSGQFTALQEGDYRIDLPVPESGEILTAKVRVIVTDLETREPQRQDAILKEVADATGGTYYVGLDSAFNPDFGPDEPVLFDKIEAVITEDHEEALPDSTFDRKLMMWLLGLIAGVLSTEWIVRRLHKLA